MGDIMVNLDYEITTKTCAVKYRDERSCIVIEGENEIIINKPINKYLNYNCNYFGSSLEGRLKSSQMILGMKYKLPIIIEESREIVFFPTSSPRNHNCTWISLGNVENYEKEDLSTVVTFTSGKKYKLDISLESFENQLLRASKLLLNLKNRKQSI